MMKDIFLFKITNDQYLKINFDENDIENTDFCCDQFTIDYVDLKKNLKIEIGLDTLPDICKKLTGINAQKLIDNKLPLEHDIADLPKAYINIKNREQGERVFVYGFVSNGHSSYSNEKYESWLYNDSDGHIVLQINQHLVWEPHYRRNSKEVKHFLANYQKMLIIIPKYQFQQWISQAQKIYEIATKNC